MKNPSHYHNIDRLPPVPEMPPDQDRQRTWLCVRFPDAVRLVGKDWQYFDQHRWHPCKNNDVLQDLNAAYAVETWFLCGNPQLRRPWADNLRKALTSERPLVSDRPPPNVHSSTGWTYTLSHVPAPMRFEVIRLTLYADHDMAPRETPPLPQLPWEIQVPPTSAMCHRYISDATGRVLMEVGIAGEPMGIGEAIQISEAIIDMANSQQSEI